MKGVNDSAMRMPKQTKLMFKNMEDMRKVHAQSPDENLASTVRLRPPHFNDDIISKF